jgi:dihydroflavonol-4-reductase
VVHTSSTATLLPSLEAPPGTEESLFDLRGGFQGHYKSSKLLAEMVALRFAARGLPLVIVHPTVVVGEGDRRPTPTGGIILHFINGTMKAYTDTHLNIVDVEDVALGHVLALEQGGPGQQYILGGENLRMVEVVSILSELTGIPAPSYAIPHRILLWMAHVNEWIANHLTRRRPLVEIESALHARTSAPTSSAKAEKELGYRPSRARPTLAKAVRWYIDHGYCNPRYARTIAERGQV